MVASTGLNTNDVVNVTISLTATPAGYRNFGAVQVLGPSDVIDINERRRLYTGLTDVSADFPNTSPEFLFAQSFFSQDPQPNLLYIGRFAQTATSGILHGASLTPAQRLLTTFTSIADGAMGITVDGVALALTGMNFGGALNLNGVAAVLQAALRAAGTAHNPVVPGAENATVIFDAENYRFTVESGSTGATSIVAYATSPAPGAGIVDVSILLGLSITPTSAGANADVPVVGIAAETPLSCVSLFDQTYGDWYMLAFAAVLADADHIAVAEYIEGATRSRIYGISSENTELYDDTRTDDLGSVLADSTLSRTLTDFSSTSAYPIASVFGLFATINYGGANTTITAKFKQLPGVMPEFLTENQAATLLEKNVNCFAAYQNGASIVQEGVMCNGNFIDSRINADWLANFVQTNLFNLYTSLPKVPQTDAGTNLQKANITASMEQAVTNGYLAPGVWNGPQIATALSTGDVLPLGFLIYAPLVATQSETDRAKRKSVPFQIAGKEAGAVHSASVAITINP